MGCARNYFTLADGRELNHQSLENRGEQTDHSWVSKPKRVGYRRHNSQRVKCWQGRPARESGGAFQPLEKDVILNVVLAALHSNKDLAARQSTNRLLHDANARGGLTQAFLGLSKKYLEISVRGIIIPEPDNRGWCAIALFISNLY